jgi:hypothetical protein
LSRNPTFKNRKRFRQISNGNPKTTLQGNSQRAGLQPFSIATVATATQAVNADVFDGIGGKIIARLGSA